MTEPAARIVELRTRSNYRPADLRAVAREQVRTARERLGVSYEEFARLLSPLLGWPVSAALVESWETQATAPPGDVLVAAGLVTRQQRYADVTAVFASRDEFAAQMPPHELFEGATRLRLCGLSLNTLCQQYPDQRLRQLIEGGTLVQALFLDPAGEAIRAREIEEDYPAGHLSALTRLNIEILTQRVRERLSPEARDRLQIGIYDETLRINLLFVGKDLCVAQWYLPDARGVDSPSFVVHRPPGHPSRGLFPAFEQVFETLWRRRKPL